MRVNVESSVYTDPRFKRLALYMGGVKLREVVGAMVGVWMVCYERRSPFLSEEDIDIAAEEVGFAAKLVRANLAVIEPEGHHVAGVDDRIGFLIDQDERASAGGKEKARRDREARAVAAAVAKGILTKGALPNGAQRHSEGHGVAMPAHAAPDLAPDLAPDPALTPDLAPEERPATPAALPAGAQSALPLGPTPSEPASAKPAASPAKKRARAVPDTEWHRAIDAFDQLFRAWAGEPPRWRDRERGQMKQLLEAGATVDQIQERANVMFDIAPRYPAEHPDLGTLLANWDKFVKPQEIVTRGSARPSTDEELGPVGERPF